MSELRRVESWTYSEIIAASRARFGRPDREPTDMSQALAEARQAELDEQERIEAERTKPKQQAMF